MIYYKTRQVKRSDFVGLDEENLVKRLHETATERKKGE